MRRSEASTRTEKLKELEDQPNHSRSWEDRKTRLQDLYDGEFRRRGFMRDFKRPVSGIEMPKKQLSQLDRSAGAQVAKILPLRGR